MLDWIDRLAGWWLDWHTQRLLAADRELSEFKLKKAEIDGHGWRIVADAPGIVILADQATALLEGQGAKNYVEFDLMPRLDRGRRPVRVTVQWARGESPASKAARLDAKLAERDLALATLCDILLGEDAADRSDEALVRAAGLMKREHDLAQAADLVLRHWDADAADPGPLAGMNNAIAALRSALAGRAVEDDDFSDEGEDEGPGF